MVSDILRLPLRAVVASSSATRSSRSAQQSPPRSAAFADGIATPPMNNPAAATSASRLDVFDSPPIVVTPNDGWAEPQIHDLRAHNFFVLKRSTASRYVRPYQMYLVLIVAVRISTYSFA